MNDEAEVLAEPDGPETEWDEPEDFWSKCHLHTILTDPPMHQLKLPAGQILRLRTPQFFDAGRFTMAFVDVVGSFPPFPVKKAGPFLLDMFKQWLEARTVGAVEEEESGDRGALLGDIRRAIDSCPETNDPRDLDRGSLYELENGEVWISARILLERVKRACPAKFTPAEFYVAFGDLGAKSLGIQRDAGWRGRVWSVPRSLLPEPALLPEAEKTNGANGVHHDEPAELVQDTIADWLAEQK